jgi:undecaprenyl-diphosphatase
MDYIKPYLDYFTANPEWAIVIVFLVAFGEALLIIGLFVPSTAALVGAGMLVGTGHLQFWPVFLATAIGAIFGDQVSYWAGRLYGDRLKLMWPLNRYPALVAKGEDFVRDHGGKSIAIGRFVPGVKAVVPGIVGMLGMSQPFFVFVNFTSGVFWAAAHVLPGMALGHTLALAGELSGRLAFVLVLLLIVLAIAGWLMRLLAAGVSPYLHRLLSRLSNWAKSFNHRSMQRFGRAVSPDNPRSMAILVFMLVLAGAFLALADLVAGLVVRDAVSNLDQSMVSLMSELRNAPADSLMVGLSMLSDRIVVWGVAAIMMAWLFFWRAWRAAVLMLGLLLSGEMLSAALGAWVERPSPVPGIDVLGGTFPSRHVLMAGLVLGLLAVLASHAMGRWSKAVVAAACGCLVIAIGFSRVYLGADWLSDVIGGALLAALLAAVFGMVIEAVPSRRIKPLGLLGVSLLAGQLLVFVHIERNHDRELAVYAPPDRLLSYDFVNWSEGAWKELPQRRVDLAGLPEEVFAAQWAGNLETLRQILLSNNWKEWENWNWKQAVFYVDSGAGFDTLPPRPLLHQGLKAKLTLTRMATDNNQRLVLRAYKSQAEVIDAARRQNVYLISVTPEILKSRFFMFNLPTTQATSVAEAESVVAILKNSPKAKLVAQPIETSGPRGVFQARP